MVDLQTQVTETKAAHTSLTIQSAGVGLIVAVADALSNGMNAANTGAIVMAVLAFAGIVYGRWHATTPLSVTGAPKIVTPEH